MRGQVYITSAFALLCATAAAHAATTATGSYNLQVSVPTLCNISHTPSSGSVGSNTYILGTLREYCNAPAGYEVMVHYSPGSMRGAVIAIGSETITLDGSGEGVLSKAQGPRILDRQLVATPGANGFDTDYLRFDVVTL